VTGREAVSKRREEDKPVTIPAISNTRDATSSFKRGGRGGNTGRKKKKINHTISRSLDSNSLQAKGGRCFKTFKLSRYAGEGPRGEKKEGAYALAHFLHHQTIRKEEENPKGKGGG